MSFSIKNNCAWKIWFLADAHWEGSGLASRVTVRENQPDSVEREPAVGRSCLWAAHTSKDGGIVKTSVVASPLHLSFLNIPFLPHRSSPGKQGPQVRKTEVQTINIKQYLSRAEGVSERQFSPDPIFNVGFIAFMAAMGLDLVYKVTRTLSYFDETEFNPTNTWPRLWSFYNSMKLNKWLNPTKTDIFHSRTCFHGNTFYQMGLLLWLDFCGALCWHLDFPIPVQSGHCFHPACLCWNRLDHISTDNDENTPNSNFTGSHHRE